MKKTILTLVFSVFFLTIGNAQAGGVTQGDWQNLNPFTRRGVFDSATELFEKKLRNANPEIFKQGDDGKFILDYDVLNGSPYEIKTFSFGYVTDEISKKSINLFLRYNIYNSEIELKASLDKDEKTIALLKKKDISCNIQGKHYSYASFSDENNKTKEDFLIQVYKGEKHSLFKRLKSAFTPKRVSQNSYKQTKKAKFKTTSSFYIKIDDAITFLPTKKKLLLKKFSTQNTAVKNYIKKHKLSKETDLIDFVKFLNTNS